NSMNAMEKAREYAIRESKPVIVHANCIRIGSHSNSDRQELYRPTEELLEAKMLDPLDKFRKILLYSEKFTEAELAGIEEEIKAIVSDAHKKALKAPEPDPASINRFVIPEPHIPKKYLEGIPPEGGKKRRLIEALNETLKSEFRANPDTFIWGQDMASGEKGGIFNVTKGMQKEFGKGRVFNAPIAEDYIVGTANGMSRYNKKIRIVIEGAEFVDYFWPAMEQFVEMTHEYWRTNGKFSPNVTIRLAAGGYIGGGLYHSQNNEAAMATFPGIRIVYPSFADDAAGLLRTSMHSEGPTLFLEPKALYNDPAAEAAFPEDFEVPFGKARIRRTGKDMTIITYGNTTHMCLQAADKIFAETGKAIEVIDLRTLVPIDKEALISSVKKTNRVLVVHEDKQQSGFGAEVAAMIQDEAFAFLDAPVRRVGSTFTPVGFNRILEKAILPDTEKIYQAAKELLDY
ncbi:MAG TPA: transketolase C-terminal domain-containing protein, partial [Bacteroidales bacterium]|nr:transketolase C-terminal domain-containing protein [Bacteroidales bacterium]